MPMTIRIEGIHLTTTERNDKRNPRTSLDRIKP